MKPTKVYAIVLYDHAANELGKLIAHWLQQNDMGSYIYAKKVDPNGPFLHMLLEHFSPNDTTREMELQIPHSFVKAIFYAADVKEIGFT